MWSLPPPPGFQGLHPEKALTVYERDLPHWRQDGATYFVTFRMADSLPQNKLSELISLKKAWAQECAIQESSGQKGGRTAQESRPTNSALARRIQIYIERCLDQGMGRCLLKQAPLASFLTSAMHHFDNERYELGCYVVMPNHAHAVVRPFSSELHALEDLVGSWKKYSSRRINRALNQHGELWQEESFDRIVRDQEHLWRVMQYIGANSGKAGLSRGSCLLWIRKEWIDLGWNFAEEYRIVH